MNLSIDILGTDGKVIDKADLNAELFNCGYCIDDPKKRLKPVHEVIRWQLNRRRSANQHVKNRSEVSGAHRKIRPQKEAGARQGDGKAPHFRGGGVAFGIHDRNYNFKLNKKYKQLAMKIVLSHKFSSNGIIVVDDFNGHDLSKTKSAQSFIKNLIKDDKVLFITSVDQYRSDAMRGIDNLPYINKIPATGLNVHSMCDSKLVFDKNSLNEIQGRFMK